MSISHLCQVIACGALACASACRGDGRYPLIAEVSAPGPFAVGYQRLEVSYRPPGAPDERVLPVHVWYPAAAGAVGRSATYKVGDRVQRPASALAAPPAAGRGPFPVAVYSHGSRGDGVIAYPYAERFASHGWVVLSPTHTGDSIEGVTLSRIENIVTRPQDISAVLDQAAIGFSEHPGAAVDVSRVFVFGHSFGGYAALAVAGATPDYDGLLASCAGSDCAYLARPEVIAAFKAGFGDTRVDAIAAQAPTLIPSLRPRALASLPIPTMLQSGRLDMTTPESVQALPAWTALDHPRDIWVNLVFGGHYSFITICDDLGREVLAQIAPESLVDGCGSAFTPTRETVPVLASYLLAFARLEVLDESRWAKVFGGEPLHREIAILKPFSSQRDRSQLSSQVSAPGNPASCSVAENRSRSK